MKKVLEDLQVTALIAGTAGLIVLTSMICMDRIDYMSGIESNIVIEILVMMFAFGAAGLLVESDKQGR